MLSMLQAWLCLLKLPEEIEGLKNTAVSLGEREYSDSFENIAFIVETGGFFFSLVSGFFAHDTLFGPPTDGDGGFAFLANDAFTRGPCRFESLPFCRSLDPFAIYGVHKCIILGVAEKAYRDWGQRVKYLPGLMLLGVGLAVNNTRAVIEALLGRRSEFVRTPKRGDVVKVRYTSKLPMMVVLELVIFRLILYAINFSAFEC